MKKSFLKFMVFLLVIFISFNITSCFDESKQSVDSSSDNKTGNESLISENMGLDSEFDNIEIEDAFFDLKFDEIEIKEISLDNISVKDILLHTIYVTDIEFIDIELTTINDEFIYLVYQNFVEYYDADISWEQFLKDVAIGAGVIIVMVTLSTVGGPIGTFFGGVIASEFTAGALIIGTAIDAAVAGYQAYQEGGDLSYILGHMLQGIGEGFKFSAFLAPISGAVSGIKALKAVSKLKKIPGFDDLTQKQASELIQQTSKILSNTKHLADDATDDVLKEAYKQAQKNLSSEITEELFINVFKQKSSIISLIKSSNAFNTSDGLIKTLRNNFMYKAGVSEEIGTSISKKLLNHSVKKLDDISETTVKNFIDQNLGEFIEIFGKSISKELRNDLLERKIGRTSIEAITKYISNSKTAYVNLVEALGKNNIDNVLGNFDSLILLQSKFGSKNILNIMNTQTLYNAMLQRNSNISSATIKKIFDGLIDGTIKSIDEISPISDIVARNMVNSREIVIKSLKDLGLSKKLSGFIDELVVEKMMMHVNKDAITSSVMKDIVSNGLTKTDILKKYGQKVYNEFTDKAIFTIGTLGLQNNLNKTLLNEVIQDVMISKNISIDIAKKIINGVPISGWGLTDDVVLEVGNTVALYYQAVDKNIYDNFFTEFAEIRCKSAKVWNLKTDYSPLNSEYASKICPTKNKYIQTKYGDVYYNSAGYPIFDKSAIARIESSSLNGLEGGAIDIRLANKIHHGTTNNIPGYTWHHLEDGRTLILIPTELHDKNVSGYAHSGGAKLLRDGAFETGGEAVEN